MNVTEPSVGMCAREPVLVAAAVEGAGDHPEVLLAEPHDREVAAEPAVRREQRRVHRAADRHVDDVHAHVLQEVERAGALEVELVERGQVDHADVLADVQVLGVGDRRPPPGVPLVRTRLAAPGVAVTQIDVRLVPLRPLPPAGVEEHRAERLLAA